MHAGSSVFYLTRSIANFTFLSPTARIKVRDFIITNIVPGDFDYDGKLDVLLMCSTNPDLKDSEIVMQLYLGNGNDTFGEEIPEGIHTC